jgi:putative hemolysin
MDELINDYDVTTVSGLIMTELSYIPKEGEKLIWNRMELEVMDMDGIKIDKVLVKSLKSS